MRSGRSPAHKTIVKGYGDAGRINASMYNANWQAAAQEAAAFYNMIGAMAQGRARQPP